MKGVLTQLQTDERDVRGVHRVESQSGGSAVEVGGGDEILDGLEDLLENAALKKLGFEHFAQKPSQL